MAGGFALEQDRKMLASAADDLDREASHLEAEGRQGQKPPKATDLG
jgi:hypothetical protein